MRRGVCLSLNTGTSRRLHDNHRIALLDYHDVFLRKFREPEHQGQE